MSELVRNDVSTESLCTVIENCTGNTRSTINPNNNVSNQIGDTPHEDSTTSLDSLHISADDTYDTSLEESNQSQVESSKPRTKLKKSVSFDPHDEKIRKFTTGEPIVDQQNPFKSYCSSPGNSIRRQKKTPPPVPAKRSTLSVRKTVTQQLREREREKEKEKERLKNETNNRKTISNGGTNLSSPDDFITTEEVLKQSKYVKTYIKNPDPYFVYDPTILARIKFEELREIADKKAPKKLKLSAQTKERIKDLKNKPSADISLSQSRLPFKKCSKPNYPELSDIKVKVGTDLDGSYFNPAEVSKNAKKFDDRVKKLHIASDDDLDEIDGPLTKSESSDEVTANSNHKQDSTDKEEDDLPECGVMNGDSFVEERHVDGTFTNTIKSKEFQEYLNKKGLTLIPRKIPNGARSVYANGTGMSKPTATTHISFKSPESVQISVDNMDSARNAKKPSVFQRLLSNSIFASRRRTTPKELVPTPRSLYDTSTKARENGNIRTPSAIKRVVLERQSFHGRPRTANLLSPAEANYLRNQSDRSRKSFASGDDLSVSISSALTNAEYANAPERSHNDSADAAKFKDSQTAPIAKPPRRTLSRDRLTNAQQMRQAGPQPQPQHDTILKPKVLRPQGSNNSSYSVLREKEVLTPDEIYFRRGLERQSLIPKRTTQVPDKRQVFGRSTSMDRNEILKRRVNRNLQSGSKSDNETTRVPTLARMGAKENNDAKLTSTPIRDAGAKNSPTHSDNQLAPKPASNKIYVEQYEWEQLKAIKERTDHELYYRMLQQQQQRQQQQQQHDLENIYERLPAPSQMLLLQPPSNTARQLMAPEGNFVRSSPQRNTFSGVTRNRQAKIIDGRAVLAADYPPASLTSNSSRTLQLEPAPRSQSVLDGMTLSGSSRMGGQRRGYESDTETPVVLRRREKGTNELAEEAAPPRRIGGILTREEILQKVKEFCRKSLNKTPTNQPHIQAIYERQPGSTDLSPVSYASVETHQRPGSRMYAAPQVPQRMQSLPQPQPFIPIAQHVVNEPMTNTASPIYAHVVKRSSLHSNQSELYDSPQRPYVVRRESDVQRIYVSRGSLQRQEPTVLPTQYVLVDAEKLLPAQVVNYYPADIYAQPQYVRPYKLQPMPGAYGYITVREPMQQQLRPRLHDGRSTPLILDRSSQQASQIYWTPQHQRLQQHTGLLPVEISPRYTLKQPHPVPAPRMDLANHRATKTAANGIPSQQQVAAVARSNTPTRQQSQHPHPLQQVQHVRHTSNAALGEHNTLGHHAYEWESGSEAGEVQRIMENQRNSGELKTRNVLRNLKEKMSRLMGRSKY